MMAAVMVDSMVSLHEALRRQPAPTASAVDASVASCLGAHLPLYTFPARPAEKVYKLARVESMPDFFAESRCDSPNGAVPPFGLDDSFNSLPMEIHAGGQYPLSDPMNKIMPYLPFGGPTAFAPALELQSSSAVVPVMSRALPRRNASDVLLSKLGDSRDGEDAIDAGTAGVPGRSLLEAALMAMWEDRADRGLFRYDVSQCPTRVLPGGLGFIAQLNEGRATKKRPTEFSMDRVLQPFDASKFNFKKAAMSEALVAFHPLNDDAADGTEAPRVVPAVAPLAAVASHGAGSPNLVLINVSPIDHGHVLLVPRVLQQLPQAVDPATVLVAMQFARELGSPHFRVGYNSLGAFATINHLHFHSYYLPLALPCESAATVLLPGGLASPAVPAALGKTSAGGQRKRRHDDGAPEVCVSRLVGYPVNSFVVEPDSSCDCDDAAALEAVAAVVGVAAERMQAANQPFNLLVSEAGRRVFIFPQCYAERQAAGVVPEDILDTGVNPASFEIAGHLVLKRAEDYAVANDGWAERLLAQVSLDEGRFMAVARLCFGGCRSAGDGGDV